MYGPGRLSMVWARTQKTWTPEQWTKVMLNGEKKFELFENMLRQQVRRRRGKNYKVDCFINCEALRRISTNLKHYHIQHCPASVQHHQYPYSTQVLYKQTLIHC